VYGDVLAKGVRVVKWYEAEFLSQQPGYDFRPGKKTTNKNYPKTSLCTFNDHELQGVLKNVKKIHQQKLSHSIFTYFLSYTGILANLLNISGKIFALFILQLSLEQLDTNTKMIEDNLIDMLFEERQV